MSVTGCLSRASNIQSELSYVIRMEVLVSSLTRPISEESIESASLLRSFTHLHLQEISKKYTDKLSGACSREKISATGFSGFFCHQIRIKYKCSHVTSTTRTDRVT